MNYVIGVDYGTDSARAVLVNAADGSVIAGATENYPRWAKGLYCDAGADRFRQHPKDYLEVLEKVLKAVVAACPEPGAIRGISVDTTASTPCLTDDRLTPLSLLDGFEENPDAMFVLWKDHTGLAEGREITDLCQNEGLPYAAHSGGTYSAENFWSKILHLFRTNPHVAAKAWSAIECCDWITAVLTGCNSLDELKPGHCCIGAKWMWAEEWGGYPPAEFLDRLDPRLKGLHLPKENFGCDRKAGTLSPEWAAKLGLGTDVVVGAGNVDSYSGAVGGGVCDGTVVMNLGTSSCYMAVMPKEKFGDRIIDGVFAQVDGSILPGKVGIEVGLSAFGDCYAWAKKLVSWPLRELSKKRPELSGVMAEAESALIADLTAAAALLPAREDAPIATDYLNGRRSPYGDSSLTGTIARLKLATEAPEVFRALVEATAFATKAVMDHLERGGVEIHRYVAVGGVAQKSPFVMQMLSDVLEKEIEVSSSKDSCALGAAIHAAVASGLYPTVEDAEKALCPPVAARYTPAPSPILRARYQRYLAMTGLK